MRWALACYILFIAALAAAVLYAGPVIQVMFGHDIFGLLEGGWKIVNGYRPYLDFPTTMGPLFFLNMALAVAVEGPVPKAIPLAIVVSLIPISVLIWRVLAPRLSPLICLGAGTYLALVWCAPYPLHFYFGATSYAMLYNRQSYVLVSLLLALLFTEKQPDWFCVGLVFGLLFFFKLTYFSAGLVLLAFHLLFSRPARREVLFCLGGFLLLALPISLYLRGPSGLEAMLSDFLVTGRNRTPALLADSIRLLETELPNALSLLLAALCFLVVLREKSLPPDQSRQALSRGHWKLAAEALAVLASSIVAEFGGCSLGYSFDVPLLAMYGFILMDRAFIPSLFDRHFHRRPAAWCSLVIIGACLWLVRPLWYNSYMSIFTSVGEKDGTITLFRTATTYVRAPGFENLLLLGASGDLPRGCMYTDKINDGLQLLRRHPEFKHKIVATLDFSDPFSVTGGKLTAPHMPLWLQYGVHISKNSYPPPEDLFYRCEGLLIPKYPDEDPQTVPFLIGKYQGYIDANFVVLDQSPFWMLYARK